jgi:hypothetical protein
MICEMMYSELEGLGGNSQGSQCSGLVDACEICHHWANLLILKNKTDSSVSSSD